MSRLELKIKKDITDYIVEWFGHIAIIFMVIFSILNYNVLPDEIPIHFDMKGEPNNYGGRQTILILPIISFLLYVGMFLLNKVPHVFNYLVEITEENVYKQYKLATKLMRSINTIIALFFCYLTYKLIGIASGESENLSIWIMLLFLGGLTFLIVRYFVNAKKIK